MLKNLVGLLPEPVIRRAKAAGAQGEAWLDGLEAQVAALESAWQIETGPVFAGGSEALVLDARLADGNGAILKLCLPEEAGLVKEAQVLKLAAGRGYAEVYAHDEVTGALLIEKLGPMLADVVEDTADQMEVLCRTLNEAWVPADDIAGLTSGEEKALWLKDYIEEKWQALGKPCSEKLIRQAIFFAEARADAFDPGSSVLVHGDAHAQNALVVGEPAGAETQCKFIDPDGMMAEKACDLASIMRDYNEELIEGHAEKLLRARCEKLVALTGADAEATWQWGYVERVSTALVLLELGMKEEAKVWFEVGERI